MQLCPLCKNEIIPEDLEEAMEGGTRIEGSMAHPECYYESLGVEIERHPIGPALRPVPELL